MRRSVVAGLLAVMLVMLTGVAAVTVVNGQRDGGSGDGLGRTLDGHPRWGSHLRRAGPRHARHDALATEFGYLTEMLAHHEEAVAAAAELQRSDRPQMRAFGQSVVTSQTAQIDQMNTWLDEWYPSRSTEVDYQPMMRDLTRLSGEELDRVFLEDMIPHHMMAVMMSRQILVRGVASHDEVNTMAVSIGNEQRAEISWMQRRLQAWHDAGGRHAMGMRGG